MIPFNRQTTRYVLLMAISLLLSVGLILLYPQVNTVGYRPNSGIVALRFAFIFLSLCFVGYHFVGNVRQLYNNIFKYRFIISFALIAVMVVLELSGSSIGMWCAYLGIEEAREVFGWPRPIRSDEWAMLTPMSFAQANSITPFEYFNNVMRGVPTDMFMTYGQAVKDIAVIFRPFMIGYLLLGINKGLAFYWMARLILLFLVTFEFSRVITNDKRLLSLAAALLITYSPMVQWWFAVNGAAEIIICGELALLCIHKYLLSENLWIRSLCAIGMTVSAGTYALALYPAWQVPTAYVWLAFAVWIIWDRVKSNTMPPVRMGRKDFAILSSCVAVLILILWHVYSMSAGTIEMVSNTVYPGNRFCTGGGIAPDYLEYFWTIFLPFTGSGCEEAVFIDFFPLQYVLVAWYFIMKRGRDRLLVLLLLVSALLAWYCVIGFPEFLSKITLFYAVTQHRCFYAVGLLNIFILIRVLALTDCPSKYSLKKCALCGALALVCAYLTKNVAWELYPRTYFDDTTLFVLSAIIIGGGYVFIAHNRIKEFVVYSALLALLSGVFVNPLTKGAEYVLRTDLISKAKEIDDRKHGVWLFETGYPMSNYLMMAGLRTQNSSATYPDLKTYRTLDPEGKYEEVYNRYSHNKTQICEELERTEYELNNPDLITIRFSPRDFRKAGIDYVLTTQQLKNEYVTLTDSAGAYKIYTVK